MINSLEVTTLNIFFTSGPANFSCLDAGYLNILASVSALVNTSNMLTHFEGFLGFPRPSLSDGKGAKDTDWVACTGATSLGSTCIRDTCIRGTGAGDI